MRPLSLDVDVVQIRRNAMVPQKGKDEVWFCWRVDVSPILEMYDSKFQNEIDSSRLFV